MTVIATPNGFSGLSTNTKPTVGVSPGNIFIETDTNKIYIWNNIAWSTILTSALNEYQQLSAASSTGNMIVVRGNVSANGVLASYTPATGKTFILYRANVTLASGASDNPTADLRNNSTIQDSSQYKGVGAVEKVFNGKGDNLIGNSSKVYDINVTGIASTSEVAGGLQGIIQ